MPLLFGPDDLDAQARLREAFDPDGVANPTKVLPAGQPVRRPAVACPRACGCDRPATGDRRVAAFAAEVGPGRRRAGGRRRRPHAVGRRRRRSDAGTAPRREVRGRPPGVVAVEAGRHDGAGAGGHARSPTSTTRWPRSARRVALPAVAGRHRRRRAGGRATAGSAGSAGARCATRVLEVRYVSAEGAVVKAGGPTVKNVSGFDLCRLLVGSLGTLGPDRRGGAAHPAAARRRALAGRRGRPVRPGRAAAPAGVGAVGRRPRRGCCSTATPTTSPPRRAACAGLRRGAPARPRCRRTGGRCGPRSCASLAGRGRARPVRRPRSASASSTPRRPQPPPARSTRRWRRSTGGSRRLFDPTGRLAPGPRPAAVGAQGPADGPRHRPTTSWPRASPAGCACPTARPTG